MTLRRFYEWNAALVLAAAVALAGVSSGCGKSEAEEGAPSAPKGLESAAVAEIVDGGAARAARVSLVDGTVAARLIDEGEWENLDVNAPLFEGYELHAEDGARAEVTLGDAKYVRFADGADVRFSRLDPDYAQLEVTDGTVFLALDEYSDNEYYEISAPGGAFVPREAGSYRVDVLPDGSTRVTVLRGTALITTPEGSFTADAGDVVNLGYEPANVDVVADGAPDYYDSYYTWSGERDQYYASYYDYDVYDVPAPIQTFEGRNDIYGLIGLAAFGLWQALDDDDDVYVWIPNDGRNPGWSPYQAGYWDYSPVVGWNWISSEPWGWAPYHYGRWDHNDRYGWYWAPYVDDRVVGISAWRTERYVWRPAQVYFWQAPQTNYYAWVPLAPGEPYIPYTASFITQSNPRYVDFRPRFLRERRGVYVVTPDELELRARPRRADRDFLDRVERLGPEQIQVAKLPKPQRAIAERKLAKVNVREDARQRGVVVTDKSLQRPRTKQSAERVERADKRANRQVRRAQERTIDVARKPRAGGRQADDAAARVPKQPRPDRVERAKPDRTRTERPRANDAGRQRDTTQRDGGGRQQRKNAKGDGRGQARVGPARVERTRVAPARAERTRVAPTRAARQVDRTVTQQRVRPNRIERQTAPRAATRQTQPRVKAAQTTTRTERKAARAGRGQKP